MNTVQETKTSYSASIVSLEEVQDQHQRWLENRRRLENIRFSRFSEYQLRQGKTSRLDYILPYFVFGLKASLLYQRGIENARNILIREHELYFDDLPSAFDGYRIVHLTDLHLDSLPGIEDTICEYLDVLRFDVAVFTGDYRLHAHGEYHNNVLDPLYRIFRMAQAPDGVFVTLGNHDTHHIARHLTEMPIQLLNNQQVQIQRNGEKITLVGTDDPHCYLTNDAVHALQRAEGDFKIALVHSPELYQEAAQAGFQFYLCGHTHAGQVCLPNGSPIIHNVSRGKHLVKGLWNHQGMTGYTSSGCGVSGVPVRLFSRGEITCFTLRRKS
ncbi:MAG: metallophosphoesterase [Bacteroidota bacterium]